MKIRKAVASDVPMITECVGQAYSVYTARLGKPPGPMLDDYRRVVRDHEVFVATTDQEIAGVLVLIIASSGILLDNVAVNPEFQGRGIGRVLIDLAERKAKHLGYHHLELYTHELMEENINMYNKLGYQMIRRVTEKGYRRVYMHKALGKPTGAQVDDNKNED